MKRIVTLVMVSLLFVMMTTVAHAVPLAIGGSATPLGVASPGGTLVDSMTSSFVGLLFGKINGTVTENVRMNATGALFEYVVRSTGPGQISQVSASFYDSYSTNVDGPIAPISPNVDVVTRSVNGETVTWGYIGDAIMTGENSGILWVQTNAPWYTGGGFSLLGADTSTLSMFGPSASTPEPASMALLGVGLVGLIGRKLKKKLNQ